MGAWGGPLRELGGKAQIKLAGAQQVSFILRTHGQPSSLRQRHRAPPPPAADFRPDAFAPTAGGLKRARSAKATPTAPLSPVTMFSYK